MDDQTFHPSQHRHAQARLTAAQLARPKYERRPQPRRQRQRDPFTSTVARLLAPHPFPAQPLCQRLREAGDAGGDTRLTDEVRPVRPAPGPACRTLQFAPGQGAPVDWGSAGWRRVGAPRRRLACLVRGLGYRRRMLVEFTLAPTQEHCLAGHQHAFESFGGVRAEVLGDHGKPAVRSHPLGPPAVFPPRYRDCAQHYGFTPAPTGVDSNWTTPSVSFVHEATGKDHFRPLTGVTTSAMIRA